MKKLISFTASLLTCVCVLAAMPTAYATYDEAEQEIVQTEGSEHGITPREYPAKKDGN